MSHYMGVPPYDGPSDTRSRSGSQTGGSQISGSHASAAQGGGSHAGGSSRPPSNRGGTSGSMGGSRPPSDAGASGPTGYPPPMGYDPGRSQPQRSPEDEHRHTVGKRVDLPPEAFAPNGLGHPFSKRPSLGKDGKPALIRVNQFRVTGVPTQDIFQYDISINPEPKKASFLKAVWFTDTVQQALSKVGSHGWIFDNRKLAWSRNNVPELRFQVDMDAERGRMPRPDRSGIVYVLVRRTTAIRLDALRAYLQGQMGWDDHVLECMNFLDHVMRQWPAQHLVAIKRNFYARENPPNMLLDNMFRHIEAIKGIYTSIRTNSSMRSGGTGLGINVDVANTAFWRGAGSFLDLAHNYLRSCKREWSNLRPHEIAAALKPVKYQNGHYGMSEMFKALRRMSKLQFHVKHRGKASDSKVYTVKGFVFDERRFGPEGANAGTYIFEKAGRKISVRDYFKERYQITLSAWQMPLIETTREGVFPMETVLVDRFSRYNFKLDGEQTSAMIKFAVTRPDKRGADIMSNVKTLKWAQDPYLKEYGIQIKDQMEAINARVIANPTIQFAKKQENPQTRGRWDLRGQVFATPNVRPLKAWGVVIVNKCVSDAAMKTFLGTFCNIYKGHGGKIANPTPEFFHMDFSRTATPGDKIHEFYNSIGRKYQASPDIMFFVLPSKDQLVYERLKKNVDIRFATLSQMMQSSHVMKNQPQYCSNLSMKVNAKLGGTTSKLAKVQFFSKPTMMIGVDVSHGSHGQATATGQPIPSMAAMTMSMDKEAVSYAAACQTNGYRREVLEKNTIQKIFPSLVTMWCKKMNTCPQHVFYFRDGVSEGEFQKVMDDEVQAVRNVIEEIGRGKIQMTVIVATKRHHIRFFPQNGDKNGNPLPGTVVETEVTHPFHYDFYLCSHVAIQGTARPVHYHVLHDEIAFPVDKLQAMIYQQCYQYIRSTTPVSIHPAIYYAHLAAARARPHEDVLASDRDPQKRIEEMNLAFAKNDNASGTSKLPMEAPDLLPIGGREGLARQDNISFFKQTMWYI